MSITINRKNKKVGNSPLATKVRMNNGRSKFIGTVSNKLQLVITLPNSQHLNQELTKLFQKYHKEALIYVVSPEEIPKNKYVVNSTDFVKLSKKFGLFIDNQKCAKSVFVIDKNRKIAYIEVLPTLNGTFDIHSLDTTLDKLIKQKIEPPKNTQYYQEITPWYLEHG
ncbi:MAG: hypothetical protein K0U38_06580 [Epsilonproteobacteria bacterium]|nr:hypothetical protein [Campylobacterota bacterium]